MIGGAIARQCASYRRRQYDRITGAGYPELWDWGLGGVASEKRGGDHW